MSSVVFWMRRDRSRSGKGAADAWIEDPASRAVVGIANVHQVRKVRSPFGKGLIMMNGPSWCKLATERRVVGVDGFGVLAYLFTMLGYENVLPVSQKAIADALGMRQPHVSRAMKRLIDVGALIEGEKSGLYRCYRLSPEFAWKGSNETHTYALRDHRKGARVRAAPPVGDWRDDLNAMIDDLDKPA